MYFRFYYRDIFKYDVKADSYTEALRILSEKNDTVFGLHPLDFDDYDLIDAEEYYG